MLNFMTDDLNSLKSRIKELEAEVIHLRAILRRREPLISQDDFLKEISQRRKERSLAGKRALRLPWLKRARNPD